MDRAADKFIQNQSNMRDQTMSVIDFRGYANEDERQVLFAEARLRMTRNLNRLWRTKMQDKKSQN